MAASTGSPASRRLTKLTPLTTRPSLTSRQGMTRTLNMLPAVARDQAVCLYADTGGRLPGHNAKRASNIQHRGPGPLDRHFSRAVGRAADSSLVAGQGAQPH